MTLISQNGNVVLCMNNFNIVKLSEEIIAVTPDGKSEVSLATYSSGTKAEVEWKRLLYRIEHYTDSNTYKFRNDEEVMG